MRSVLPLSIIWLCFPGLAFGQNLVEHFDRFDRDGNGQVTAEEARDAAWFPRLLQRFDKNQDGILQKTELEAPPASEPSAQLPRPKSVEGTPWDFTFERDFTAGTKDIDGNVMHATNVMDMAAHNGKLWAGLSYRGPEPEDERAATIIVKESSQSPWKIAKAFGPEFTRVGTIENVTFTTDHSGKPLDPPFEVLLASDWKTTPPRTVGAWSYNVATDSWHRAVVHSDFRGNPEIRRFVSHVDQVTGVHLVFGLGNGTIYRGAYDPDEPGLIRWLGHDSLSSPLHRCLSAASVGGKLYVQFAIRVDDPEPLSTDGGLFRRVDGPEATWEHVKIEEWLDPNDPKLTTRLGAMRAMVPLDNGDLLFSWKEPNYSIERLVPEDGYRAVTEINVRDYLEKFWGRRPSAHMIIGYNEMLAATHPTTGEDVHLIGLFARYPGGEGTPEGNSSWFLVRHGAGDYSVGEVKDPDDPILQSSIGLRGTRSIIKSPFPDESSTFYFGGFDEVNFRVRGDHGWIYKATLPESKSNTPTAARVANDFVPATIPTGSPNEVRDAEYYYPLMWAPCYYNKGGDRDNDDICLRRLDPKTGGFVPVDDHRNSPDCIVIAKDVGRKGAQGPELARSKDGFYVFFNKQVDGKHEVWRTTPFGLDPKAAPIEIVKVGSHPTRPVTQVMHSRGHELERVGVMLSAGRGTQFGLLDEIEGDLSKLRDLPYRKRGDKARWFPGSYQIAFVGQVEPDNLQIVAVDAEEETHQIISNPDIRRNYETATPFRSPGFPDEVLVAATAEDEIVILRDSGGEHWEELRTLRSPDPELPYLYGVEIIERDAVGAPGVPSIPWPTTYLVAWATNSLIDDERTHSGIFLWSLDGAISRRIDSGPELGRARYDPELVVISQAEAKEIQIKVHFVSREVDSRLLQVYLGETGLKFPLSTSASR